MRTKRLAFLFVAALALLLPTRGLARVDTGQGIFFPVALGHRIESYTSFPATWWDFLVFGPVENADDWDYVKRTCGELKQKANPLIATAICGDEISAFRPILKAWARDVGLRESMPSPDELSTRLKEALARASLPMPSEIIEVLRFDPLGEYRKLVALISSRAPISLPRQRGIFFDSTSHRALIPVQMSFAPAEAEKTAQVTADLAAVCGPLASRCARWTLLGAHQATLANQSQVRRDLSRVSLVGLSLLVLGFSLLTVAGRGRLLGLLPIVGVALALSAGVTELVYGTIHGLTLSFGSGIVGLALDYGFHRALNPQDYVIRSNRYGILTTLASLGALMMSGIPLIRQMMFFSALGILVAFWLMEFGARRFHLYRGVEAFAFTPRPSAGKLGLTMILILGVPVGAVCLRPSFDLARFNFQSVREMQMMKWLATAIHLQPPLFIAQDSLAATAAAQKWGEQNGIRVENASKFIPPFDVQVMHLKTWRGTRCEGQTPTTAGNAPLETWAAAHPEIPRDFFAPFFEAFGCQTEPIRGDEAVLPSYLADYRSHGKWLALFFPSDPLEGEQIRRRYSDASSLREIVETFPHTLSAELRWMIPFSGLLILGLLGFYYRKFSWSCLPLIPFFTGVGFAAWLALLLHREISFVTLVGVVMLCGLSVDYGIFATDATRFGKGARGAWSAIVVAAGSTFSGFFPLLFCRHPVLIQLGEILTAGTFGTAVGALWGVPSVARYFMGVVAE